MSNFDDFFISEPAPSGSQFRMGTVTVLVSGKPLVQFDGESTASQKVYKRMSSYISPAVNDRVLLLRFSGTYIILGKVS